MHNIKYYSGYWVYDTYRFILYSKIVIKYYAVAGNEYKNMSCSRIKSSESPVTCQSSCDARVEGHQMAYKRNFDRTNIPTRDGYTYTVVLSIVIYEFSEPEILKTILF